MVVVMVLAFLVTWLPYAAMALAVIIDSSLYIDPVIATIPVYLAKSSTLYNPIIYVFMNRQVLHRHAHLETQIQWQRIMDFHFCVLMSAICLCFQFRGYAVPIVLCGWNPWASDTQMSEGESTIVTLSKGQKVSPKQSLKEWKCEWRPTVLLPRQHIFWTTFPITFALNYKDIYIYKTVWTPWIMDVTHSVKSS